MNDPNTSQKAYWKIINRAMNKCRAPKIPPLLVNNMFILNCREKSETFQKKYSKQCMPITPSSVLPPLHSLTDKKNDHNMIIPIQFDEILSLIRNLIPNKVSSINRVFVHVIPQLTNYYILLMKSIRRSMTPNL